MNIDDRRWNRTTTRYYDLQQRLTNTALYTQLFNFSLHRLQKAPYFFHKKPVFLLKWLHEAGVEPAIIGL